MACSIDHLRKVASEGFPLIDEFRGGHQAGKAYSRPSPPRNHDHYHHLKPVPNQYVYHGPQAITVVQEPETGSYHQIQTPNNSERWYVCQVSPIATNSSNDAASYYSGMLIK
ncbi:hypothetical protein COLO4_13817 [Corchorus olitorius]|uniref:Uncharacterized protein n=1 Tax=Corchorus olitorius TaxID=93759 RepID=A0A1R3JUP0_9ROSI|nr:hypothetical protein COLO4_13817 [Corchorus olitorius]